MATEEKKSKITVKKTETSTDMDVQLRKDLEVANIKVVAIIGYIGLLFLIPMLAYPKNKFAIFHANQGLLLFLTMVILNVVMPLLGVITLGLGLFLWPLVWLFLVVLFILGLINVKNGTMKRLPLIGKRDILEVQK